MGLFSFFKSNKKGIVLDEYAQVKLVLAKALFENLQRSIELYAEDTKDIPNDSLSAYSLEFALSLTQTGIGNINNSKENYLKAIKSSEKNAEDRTRREREYRQYHEPSLNYFAETMAPWLAEYGHKHAKGWLDDSFAIPAPSELDGMRKPVIEVHQYDKVFLTGQKERISELVLAYGALVHVLPDKLEVDYLRKDAMKMLENGQIIALRKFLRDGLPDLEGFGLDELLFSNKSAPGAQPS